MTMPPDPFNQSKSMPWWERLLALFGQALFVIVIILVTSVLILGLCWITKSLWLAVFG